MGYAIYRVGKRWGGYGVPTVCEYPSCKEKIDRGISFACGGEPFSEYGCDRYFCSKHLNYKGWDTEEGNWCKHEEDCECEWYNVCERCASNQAPFPYKPETKAWARHILKDKSWKEWREENIDEVEEYKKIVNPH